MPFTPERIWSVAAIASPTGPRIAGKHGVGLLSIGATTEGGFDLLAHHWDVMEQRAAQFGTVADRNQWRLVGPMHIAETREQAIEDVRYGLDAWCDYTQKVLAVPHFRAAGETFEERIAWVNETGLGVIGTPDDAIMQIERLEKQSNGGFGAYLMVHHEWARPAAVNRHYELFAQHLKPRFQRLTRRTIAAEERAIGEWQELGDRVESKVPCWWGWRAAEHDTANRCLSGEVVVGLDELAKGSVLVLTVKRVGNGHGGLGDRPPFQRNGDEPVPHRPKESVERRHRDIPRARLNPTNRGLRHMRR